MTLEKQDKTLELSKLRFEGVTQIAEQVRRLASWMSQNMTKIHRLLSEKKLITS